MPATREEIRPTVRPGSSSEPPRVETLTASCAPFGQKPPALRSDTLMVGVVALTAPVRPLVAAAVASVTV